MSTLHMLKISYSKEITIWEGDSENSIFEVYMVNVQIRILYGIFSTTVIFSNSTLFKLISMQNGLNDLENYIKSNHMHYGVPNTHQQNICKQK